MSGATKKYVMESGGVIQNINMNKTVIGAIDYRSSLEEERNNGSVTGTGSIAAVSVATASGTLDGNSNTSTVGRACFTEQYVKWLDAIHTVCVKLDDLCQKLDSEFPHSMSRWEETTASIGGGIAGARKLFKQPDELQSKSNPLHYTNVGSIRSMKRVTGDSKDKGTINSGHRLCGSFVEPIRYSSPSKRSRLDPLVIDRKRWDKQGHTFPETGMSIFGTPLPNLSQGNNSLISQLQTQTLSTLGVNNAVPVSAQSHSYNINNYGKNMCNDNMNSVASNVAASAAVGLSSGGTINNVSVLPTEEEYEYLLELPEQDGPDPSNPEDLKCEVAGVYWDKRSWIASWYEGGKRYYKSFSAKTHGFYKSKFWAIKVRLSKVRAHSFINKVVRLKTSK